MIKIITKSEYKKLGDMEALAHYAQGGTVYARTGNTIAYPEGYVPLVGVDAVTSCINYCTMFRKVEKRVPSSELVHGNLYKCTKISGATCFLYYKDNLMWGYKAKNGVYYDQHLLSSFKHLVRVKEVIFDNR